MDSQAKYYRDELQVYIALRHSSPQVVEDIMTLCDKEAPDRAKNATAPMDDSGLAERDNRRPGLINE